MNVTKTTIQNPILRGFNPDPSIIRVENDYYIATSTFEWFPGVQIHHSRDLVHWQLITRPLNRRTQLDMLGVPDSCGVWAPCLSYHEGVYYLVFSNVKSFDGVWKDTPNYLVTTQDIRGDWSEPIFLNSSGFDGSLFHDDDGRKWYTSMLMDHRKGKFFGGIILQEYDPQAERLVGEVHYIFEGTELGCTEGPHIYKKDGYYYLLLAEGGTEYNHAMTIARAREITGPYELHPQTPLVTSKNNPNLALQKAGHGDLVQTQNGDWYGVFLVGRPLTTRGRCITGRETAIQRFIWDEGEWITLVQGGSEPQVEVEAPNLPSYPFEPEPIREDFETDALNIHFQSLRLPVSAEWASLQERSGFLRLYGRESLASFHYQSLLARRVQHTYIEASTCVEFTPDNFQQMAGLVCYYNTSHYYYLYLSRDKARQKYLNIIACDKFNTTEPLEGLVDVSNMDRVYLKAVIRQADLQFYYAVEEGNWIKIGGTLDASILSDDYIQYHDGRYRPAFTGAFVGICCQDLTGNKKHADFDWFDYQEII
ncbi:MAG TPA: glycoside hydrolase 43 family protein [Microscillaceae bacterium]|nr:glycoside hydrolase 43 family protein [Microscillaceae bacterium]